MIFDSFTLIPKRSLGIDIGTSSIRIVELSRFGERIKLENYGEISAKALYAKPFRTFEKSTLLLSNKNISKAIKAVLKEAKIQTKKAVIAIPDFSSFFTNFELPPMTQEELEQAVVYEARKHVPMPLGEVTLDWQITEGMVSDRKGTELEILLVVVPNEIISQYKMIAEDSELELLALEAEVFGILRSSVLEDEKEGVALVDIGAQSTTCSIIYNRVLRLSHSFDVSGNQLTELVAKSLSVDYRTAQKLKEKYGLLAGQELGLKRGKELRTILLPLIDVLVREIKRICRNFGQSEGKEVKKVILAGSTALLPGLKEYLKENLSREVELANPFSKVFYPPILEKTLERMGPSYAIAVGMAMRGLE